EAGPVQVLGGAVAVVDGQSRAPGVVPRRRKRFLRRVDTGHRCPLGGERLGEDATAAPHVEDALAPEPAEHAAEVFDPHRVQLVQPGERPRVAPPHAGDPVYQALVLLGLRETAQAGELVGHAPKSMAGRRLGEAGGGRGSLDHSGAWRVITPRSTSPILLQAVASTLGNGGTSRNHSPASREFLSTSTSNRSATRTTVAGRWRPTRMWSTDSLVFFSTVSAVSTSTAATRGCDLRPGNTTRPSLAGSGIGRVSRV